LWLLCSCNIQITLHTCCFLFGTSHEMATRCAALGALYSFAGIIGGLHAVSPPPLHKDGENQEKLEHGWKHGAAVLRHNLTTAVTPGHRTLSTANALLVTPLRTPARRRWWCLDTGRACVRAMPRQSTHPDCASTGKQTHACVRGRQRHSAMTFGSTNFRSHEPPIHSPPTRPGHCLMTPQKGGGGGGHLGSC